MALATRRKTRGAQVLDTVALAPRRVVIVAVPPVRALDVFGPAEVFGDANRLRGGPPAYLLEVVSAAEGLTVESHVGTPVTAHRSYRDVDAAAAGPADTLLVAGGLGARGRRYDAKFLDWLRGQAKAARRFGSICTGALVLAEAGLLDGRRATTHWNWWDDLERGYPRVRVERDPIWVRDGPCYTSAGVTAGIDLTLGLVEEDLGRGLALQVAQMMVVFLRRPGGQAQFSASLVAQSHERGMLGDVLPWIADHLREDLSVERLARRAAMSRRNFARQFAREAGTTPARFVEDLRLERARRQLESTQQSLAEIADACGLGSAEVLRRLFARRLGVTPGRYRVSFGPPLRKAVKERGTLD